MSTRLCADCSIYFPKGGFSKKQWKGGQHREDRRCKGCNLAFHRAKAAAPPFRSCTACGQSLPPNKFYNTQWDGPDDRADRRCKSCHDQFHRNKNKQQRPKMSYVPKPPSDFDWIQANDYEMQRAEENDKWQKELQRQREEKARKKREAKMKRKRQEEARKKAEEEIKKRARKQKEANGGETYVKMTVMGTRVYAPIGMPEDEVKWRRHKSEIPHHCDLGRAIEPHHTFNVTSGTLRFGPEDLVRSLEAGALDSNEAVWSYRAIGPTFVTARISAISTIFNPACTFRAYNGKWLIFRLEKRVAPSVCPEFNSKTGELVRRGWFICHSAISSPLKEARNLLYHGYFGDELIKCDGAYVSHYPKPIEYHRFDYSGDEWKKDNAQEDTRGASKYLVGDSKFPQAAFDLTTDGRFRNQSCIVGFARKDAAKSFLLFDNDCDLEQTYFRQNRLPIYAMPWTKLSKIEPDENSDRFFILTMPSPTHQGSERSKHRYLSDIRGEIFATCPVNGNQGSATSQKGNERERKRRRTIRSFFGPVQRAGLLITLPSDVINPHLLKFLNLRDCLPLLMTCRYLRRVLDPYKHGHIFDLQAYQINEDIIPDSLRCPDTGRLTVEIEDYVEEQDKVIAQRAATSDVIVQSVLKNEVMTRKYHPDDECRGDADELVKRMVRNLIRHERTVSLEYVASLGRVSEEAFYFAIRCEATESVAVLRRVLKADEWARKCTKCKTEFGAFSCRRNGVIAKDCFQHDETKEIEDEHICKVCRLSGEYRLDRYCQLCDRHECRECCGRGWERQYSRADDGHDTHITYASCHQCKRNVCFARHKGNRPYSCSLQCTSCQVVVCRDCSNTQWYHCSKCYCFSSGQIKPFCSDCSKSGCSNDEWGWHQTKYLHPHYFRSAEVVEYFGESEEEESAESDKGEEDYGNGYGGCYTCGGDCFNGLGFRNPWCSSRY